MPNLLTSQLPFQSEHGMQSFKVKPGFLFRFEATSPKTKISDQVNTLDFLCLYMGFKNQVSNVNVIQDAFRFPIILVHFIDCNLQNGILKFSTLNCAAC